MEPQCDTDRIHTASGQGRVQLVLLLLPGLPPAHRVHVRLCARAHGLPLCGRVDRMADGGAGHVIYRGLPSDVAIPRIRDTPVCEPSGVDCARVLEGTLREAVSASAAGSFTIPAPIPTPPSEPRSDAPSCSHFPTNLGRSAQCGVAD